MNKAHKETWLLIFASFFGALVSKAVDTLMSDFNNKLSWLMFFVVLGIIYFVIYKSLKVYHQKVLACTSA